MIKKQVLLPRLTRSQKTLCEIDQFKTYFMKTLLGALMFRILAQKGQLTRRFVNKARSPIPTLNTSFTSSIENLSPYSNKSTALKMRGKTRRMSLASTIDN